MLSIAIQVTLNENLVRPGSQHFTEIDGICPEIIDLLCDRSLLPPLASRLH